MSTLTLPIEVAESPLLAWRGQQVRVSVRDEDLPVVGTLTHVSTTGSHVIVGGTHVPVDRIEDIRFATRRDVDEARVMVVHAEYAD